VPNWADDEGRYWWTPPGKTWHEAVEIPHAPLSVEDGCDCIYCVHNRPGEGRIWVWCDLCPKPFRAVAKHVKVVMEKPSMCMKCKNGHILDKYMMTKALERAKESNE